MPRRLLALPLLLAALLPGVALADTICWRLQTNGTPPTDLIDVVHISTDGPVFQSLPETWPIFTIQDGRPFYYGLGSGAASVDLEDVEPPLSYVITTFIGHESSSAFGGNQACKLTLIITPTETSPNVIVYPGVSWNEKCGAGPGSSFSNSGKLRQVGCGTVALPLSGESGQAMAAGTVALPLSGKSGQAMAAGCGGDFPLCVPQ